MSRDDDRDDRVVPFPRVVLPGSLDAPVPNPEPQEPDVQGGGEDAPSWPRLPQTTQLREMGPPLHLAMPGVPDPDGDGGADGEEEGEFVPPAPEDPDHPTARDTAAVAMALMTALGVAAAKGMWHRARHRQALADQARANADRAAAKQAAAGAGNHGGSRGAAGSKGSGTPASFRNEAPRRKQSDKSGGHGGAKSPSHRGDEKRRTAPKADRGGKPVWTEWDKPDKPKRGKDGDATGKGKKDKLPKQTEGKDSKGPGAGAPTAKRSGGPRAGQGEVTASKRKAIDAGPGAKDPAGSAGRRRRRKARDGQAKKPPKWWSRRRAETGKDTPDAESPGGSRRRGRSGNAGDGQAKGPRKWRSRRDETGGKGPGRQGRGDRRRTPPPPPGFEGMRPPPGADRSDWVKVERVDQPGRKARPDRRRPEAAVLAGAPADGRLGLPAGPPQPSTTSPAPSPPPPPASPSAPTPDRQEGAVPVSVPVKTTQYADADLTVYDVVEADADMAEEITAGVDEARATAEGCERLMSRLEALHAECVELQVPGVLEGMLLRLMEKTGTVKARAEAIAAHLPAAAEAIATAGTNAAARHQNPADVTRDQGHIRPAEREYHQE